MAEVVVIDVTNDDIVAAIQDRKHGELSSETCPVAQALQRQSPAADRVSVSSQAATVYQDDIRVDLKFPPQVAKFILAFDNRQTVLPLRFEALATVVAPTPSVHDVVISG